MPFSETAADYEEKLRRFVRQHPDATEADLKMLFPHMVDVAAVWARFNSVGRNGNGAKAAAAKASV